MKKFFFFAVAAIVALSSCNNEEVTLNNGNQSTDFPTFTATIEGAATRTALGENGKVNWENGDEVLMMFKDEHFEENEDTYIIYEATPGVDASTATLTCKTVLQDNPAADRLFNAIYPASLITSESDVYFPETQVYAGDNKIGFAPMSSIFNVDFDNGTVKPTPETIEFKNATALLKITVPSSQMTSVQNITVSSDLAMYGNAGFEMRTNTLYIDGEPNPGVNDHLILDCYAGNGNANVEIPADGSKIFYIAIPSSIFADGEKYGYLQIDVTDGTTTKSMRTNKAGGIQIDRNKIYPITFAENYIAPAVWENALTLDVSQPTSIVIETGIDVISSYTEDATHKKLNTAGTLWEVLDNQVLRIQTSSNKIIGHNSFDDGYGEYLGLFGLYFSVETITGLDNLDMSEVTNMSRMFWGCEALTSLDLSSWNTSNVTNMHEMFGACNALESIDLSNNFTTSNVTDMTSMFANCEALQTLDLSNFNTENVTNMSYMFSVCKALQTLDLSNFNTDNVTDMNSMFDGCQALQTLDLRSFNTDNVTDMSYMFANCSVLQTLDLSSFHTMNAPDMSYMFYMCTSLESLYLGDSFMMGSEMIDMFNGSGADSFLTVYGANSIFVDIVTHDPATGWYERIMHFDGY